MRTQNFFISHVKKAAGILLLLLVLIPAYAAAEQAAYPVPAYAGAELQKLRGWEKTWVGKKINSSNAGEVKEFLTESFYNIITDPKTWGEIWFEVSPYSEIKETTGMIEYTNKYNGTCKIGPNEELLNWVCGIPFPTPTTAIEVMWNFNCPTHGDTFLSVMNGVQVDGRKGYDREMKSTAWNMWWTGRTDIPPLPALPGNTKGIRKATHTAWDEPKILKGDRNLAIRWTDPNKEWGQWGFSTSTRRVTRRSAAFRWTQLGGSDMTPDDGYGYDYEVNAQTYKLVGRKELLAPRHNSSQAIYKQHVAGQMYDSGIKKERINTYVIEAKHKDPNYIYGKQIYYIDPESYIMVWADKYDPDGKLFKLIECSQEEIKQNYDGQGKIRATYVNFIDVQRLHSTIGAYPRNEVGDSADGPNGKYYRETFYTPKALEEFGY
ncbi:MAG: DUF1329 domain-containing protein [Deltaproteobacteria bacterium]|nr:DUF1329 domain-containing protein [Deltaproteobacteria bacterium]